MKKMYLGLSVLAIAMISCKGDIKVETTTTDTDTTKVAEKEAPEVKLDSVAEQKAWMDYATPGDAHKMLADEAGSWTNDMTFWHEEGAQPMKATSTAEIKMIMDGRYQQSNYKGMMMGMPFEGQSTVSFDNSTKEYTSTWIDNMGTGMMVMKGKKADGANSIEFKGEMVDPAYNKARPCREVYTIVDANTRKMEMYCSKGGNEFKNMEIVMKRK